MGKGRVTDWAVVVRNVPAMELKEQTIVLHEALVVRAAVGAAAAEEMLVPTATRLNIAGADQGLWTHRYSVLEPAAHAPLIPAVGVAELVAQVTLFAQDNAPAQQRKHGE